MIAEYEARPKPKMKQGRIRSGWELTKSSWNVLKLDKELAWLPLLGSVLSVFVVAAVITLVLVIGFATLGSDAVNSFFNTTSNADGGFTATSNWQYVVTMLGGYLVLGTIITFIINLFGGAVVYGATKRFNGGDPTVKDSLKHSWRRWQPLALFSLMMTTIGLILQLLEERLPFAGKIAVWLVGAAWNIANVFAVPVIVLSEKSVSPLAATKESVSIIKKVWGEGIVAQVSIGLIAFFAYLVYIVISSGVVVGLMMATSSVTLGIGLGVVAGIGLLALILLFSTLGSILKAALYHLATTGEAPELFNKRLLENLMTPKKARKIFA